MPSVRAAFSVLGIDTQFLTVNGGTHLMTKLLGSTVNCLVESWFREDGEGVLLLPDWVARSARLHTAH